MKQKSKLMTNVKRTGVIIQDKFVFIGSKLGSNKVLSAIRDAFAVSSIPMLGAAFPLIIAMIFFQDGVLFGKIPGIEGSEYIQWTTKYISNWWWSIWSAATAPFTLYFVVSIGYFMSKSYLKNGAPLTGAIVTTAAYFTLYPLGTGWNETKFLGTDAILLGVFVGLLAPYIFAKLMAIKKLRFKLPDSVPPVISEVFASIFSIAIVLLSFSFIGNGWMWIADAANIVNDKGELQDTLFKAVEYGLAKPLANIGINVGTTAVILFLIAFFWFFGLHGSNIMSPVTSVLWTPIMLTNAEYWKVYLENGSKGDYWTLPLQTETHGLVEGLYPLFNQNMAYIGGTGATLGLLLAIFAFSKYAPYRQVAKLAVGPGVFGINEPVNFGIPIIYNIAYFIPYVIMFTIWGVMTHLFIQWHWVRPVVVPLGWTPFILQNFLMSGMDWRSILIDTAGLAIAFGYWSVFLKIGEKTQKTIDAKEKGISYEEYNEILTVEWNQMKSEKKLNREKRKELKRKKN